MGYCNAYWEYISNHNKVFLVNKIDKLCHRLDTAESSINTLQKQYTDLENSMGHFETEIWGTVNKITEETAIV